MYPHGQPSRFQILLAVTVSAVPAALVVVWVALYVAQRLSCPQPPRRYLLDDF